HADIAPRSAVEPGHARLMSGRIEGPLTDSNRRPPPHVLGLGVPGADERIEWLECGVAFAHITSADRQADAASDRNGPVRRRTLCSRAREKTSASLRWSWRKQPSPTFVAPASVHLRVQASARRASSGCSFTRSASLDNDVDAVLPLLAAGRQRHLPDVTKVD